MENNLFEVSYVNGKKTERAIVVSPNPEMARTLVTDFLNSKKYDFTITGCIPIFAYFPDWNNGVGEHITTPLATPKTATHSA